MSSFCLSDDVCVPKGFDEFYARLMKGSAKRGLSASAENSNVPESTLRQALPECSLCASGRKTDVRKIARSCQGRARPCEGHRCQCVAREGGDGRPSVSCYPCCSTCLAQVLWKSTSEVMKSQGRYRGKCPFCSAEFCDEDLLLISK